MTAWMWLSQRDKEWCQPLLIHWLGVIPVSENYVEGYLMKRYSERRKMSGVAITCGDVQASLRCFCVLQRFGRKKHTCGQYMREQNSHILKAHILNSFKVLFIDASLKLLLLTKRYNDTCEKEIIGRQNCEEEDSLFWEGKYYARLSSVTWN